MPKEPIQVLLVEDNPADVRYAQETLREFKLQNQLHVVSDGEAALQFLRREGPHSGAVAPDVVLLDSTLPKMDGMEVIAEIRADANLRDLPVVVLAASKLDHQMLKEYEIPIDCVILKPLTLSRFLEAVKCFPQFGISIVRIAAV